MMGEEYGGLKPGAETKAFLFSCLRANTAQSRANDRTVHGGNALEKYVSYRHGATKRQGCRLVLAVLLMGACMVAGAYMHKCQSGAGDEMREGCVSDTTTYIDTIPYYKPLEASVNQTGSIVRLLPVFIREKGESGDISSAGELTGEDVGKIGMDDIADSGNIAMEIIPDDIFHEAEQHTPDSVEVVIPITQKEYEGAGYHAWISGYEPRMDSIYVFPRYERVTVRERCKGEGRWGVGVFAGYGMTPKGFQPCVGVSVHYTLWRL